MKKGITVASLVIYVALFFAFTVFAVSIGSNVNFKVINEKGNVLINKNYLKLYTNLLESSENSDSYYYNNNQIVFSNNDVYTYVQSDKIIYKNGGKLITDVMTFEPTDISHVVNNYNAAYFEQANVLCFKIELEKYNAKIEKSLFINLGDVSYE